MLVATLIVLGMLALVLIRYVTIPVRKTSSSNQLAPMTWTATAWRYMMLNGKDCATVTRQPEHYYQVVLLGEDGQPLLTELFQFDSDREMEKFVEGVCAKR